MGGWNLLGFPLDYRDNLAFPFDLTQSCDFETGRKNLPKPIQCLSKCLTPFKYVALPGHDEIAGGDRIPASL